MGNDFFDKHPTLGSVFDFNHDGNLNLGEAASMAALGNMSAEKLKDAMEGTGREDDYSYGAFKKKKKKAKKKSFDDCWDEPWEKKLSKIDDYDKDEVFEAVINQELDEYATEILRDSALGHGLKFDEEEVEEMMDYISDEGLKTRLQLRTMGQY